MVKKIGIVAGVVILGLAIAYVCLIGFIVWASPWL